MSTKSCHLVDGFVDKGILIPPPGGGQPLEPVAIGDSGSPPPRQHRGGDSDRDGSQLRPGHLEQDRRKLQNSEVIAGYLVHLSRDARRDSAVESYVDQHALDPNIKVAYAHSGDGGTRVIKLLNEPSIRPR